MGEAFYFRDALRKAQGGEGSRGGSVLGHTSSGKPIYASGHHSNEWSGSLKSGKKEGEGDTGNQAHYRMHITLAHHPSFSAADHKEAAAAHAKNSQEKGDIHDRLSAGHQYAAGFKRAEGSKGK